MWTEHGRSVEKMWLDGTHQQNYVKDWIAERQRFPSLCSWGIKHAFLSLSLSLSLSVFMGSRKWTVLTFYSTLLPPQNPLYSLIIIHCILALCEGHQYTHQTHTHILYTLCICSGLERFSSFVITCHACRDDIICYRTLIHIL